MEFSTSFGEECISLAEGRMFFAVGYTSFAEEHRMNGLLQA